MEGHFVVVESSLFYITKVCLEFVICTSERYKNCKHICPDANTRFWPTDGRMKYCLVSLILTLITKVFDRISETCGLARHLIIHGIKVVPVQNVRIAKPPDY